MKKINNRFTKVAVIFFIFYLLASGYYFKRIYQPWGTCDTDFSVFTQAAKNIAQKQDIYNTPFLEGGKDYYKYSPAFALAMIPLSKLHRHISVPLWYLSIFVFFMSAIFLAQQVIADGNRQVQLSAKIYFFTILLSLRFLLSVVQRVQSDCLVLFLLALFIFASYRKKELLAGSALAAATMVKLTPLVFLPFLLFKKRFKASLAYGLALGFFLLTPGFYLGWSKNLNYLKEWLLVHQKNPPDYIFWYKNQSLLSSLSRFLGQDSPLGWFSLERSSVMIIFVALAAVLFVMVLILGRKNSGNQSGLWCLTESSLMLSCMILFSPLAWKHTFVHLVIAYFVILYYLIYINPKDRPTKILLVGSFVLITVLNPELTKPVARLIQLYSSVTLGALLVYAALFRIGLKTKTQSSV